jgi:hypothetical protein
MKAIYTASAHVTGGRLNGRGQTNEWQHRLRLTVNGRPVN